MADFWARIKVTTSLGEGIPGQAPAAVRKAAIDFESIYPRRVLLSDSMTSLQASTALAGVLELKIANCDCREVRFNEGEPFEVEHTIDPRHPEIWDTLTGAHGGAIYQGIDADGSPVFIGFEA